MNMNKPSPRPICTIPEWVVEGSINRGVRADHLLWIINTYGIVEAERIATLYGIGATKEGASVFWQRDIEGRVRTGKVMTYNTITGKRLKIEKALLKSFEQHLYFISRSLALLWLLEVVVDASK